NKDDRASAVALDGQGRIVLAGYTEEGGGNYDFAVARLQDNGSFDYGFGISGTSYAGFDLGGNLDDRASAVALDTNGRIVVAGYTEEGGGNYDFAVARLQDNGSF